jgi:uncharacterized protein
MSVERPQFEHRQATEGPEVPAWFAVIAALFILLISLAGAVGMTRVILGILPVRFQTDEMLVSLIDTIGAQCLVVILTTLMLRRVRGGVFAWLSLDRPVGGAWVYLGYFSSMLAVVAVMTGILYFGIGHDLFTDLTPFLAMIHGPWWWLALAAIGFGAPLAEEVMFRGFLQTAFARTSLGFWWSAVGTTLFWTLLHYKYSLAGQMQVFLVGLMFSAFLFYSRSLRVPLFCHAAYNTLLVLVVRWFL